MPEQGSLWKSALPGGLTPAASALNSSIAVDRRLWREDIQGSLIHAAMLAVLGSAAGLFALADPIARCLGRTGTMVVTRLFGMLLAALSIQFVIDGLKGSGLF